LLPPRDDPAQRQRRAERGSEGAQRQSRAGPVLGRLREWLDEQRPGALPRSPLGQAVGYAPNNWGALGRYAERGYLAIDNNLGGRTPRAVALGGGTGWRWGASPGARRRPCSTAWR
jgi:hypothetical protein